MGRKKVLTPGLYGYRHEVIFEVSYIDVQDGISIFADDSNACLAAIFEH